jgi:hypothetical protein
VGTPVEGILIAGTPATTVTPASAEFHNHNWDPRTPSCSNNIAYRRGNKILKDSNISKDASNSRDVGSYIDYRNLSEVHSSGNELE